MNKKVFRIVALTLCILNTLFVFSNSLMNADTSSTKSKGVRAFINSIINRMGLSFEITEHFVRKAAHFMEFMLLGILLTLVLVAFDMVIHRNITIPLFFGLLIAVLDEFIQLHVEGRSGMVSDVVLDFSGIVTGVFFVLIILIIKKKASNRKP